TIPILSQLVAPETLYLISEIDHFVSIHVDDPQGIDDIATVTCSIFHSNSQNPVKIDTLVDDGTHGDIITRDGIYTTGINVDFAQEQAGTYTLIFKAIDLSGNESEILSHELTVIAGEENIPPTITDVILPLVFDIKDTIGYLISIKANDPQGLDDIELLVLQIFPPTNNIPVLKDTLWDDGQNSDAIAGDGIYSQIIKPAFSKSVIGKFSFHFQAFDKSGGESNAIIEVIDVVNKENSPPYIYNLSAPSTMKLLIGKDNTAVISISATDPQGLSDIRDVRFYSFKPDGTEAKNSPIKMTDDGKKGSSGDEVANDGIYSVIIKLPSDTPTGDYTFIFEAIDRSDAKSNQIPHILTVIQ
ncbi:MAG: hypothetical protein JSW07_14415, partial [bacterium]